jgi:hypothetical protein
VIRRSRIKGRQSLRNTQVAAHDIFFESFEPSGGQLAVDDHTLLTKDSNKGVEDFTTRGYQCPRCVYMARNTRIHNLRAEAMAFGHNGTRVRNMRTVR